MNNISKSVLCVDPVIPFLRVIVSDLLRYISEGHKEFPGISYMSKGSRHFTSLHTCKKEESLRKTLSRTKVTPNQGIRRGRMVLKCVRVFLSFVYKWCLVSQINMFVRSVRPRRPRWKRQPLPPL